MKPPIKNKILRTFISLLFVVHILILIKFILLKDPGDLKSHFTEDYSFRLFEKNIAQGNYIPFYSVNFYTSGADPLKYTKENLVGNVVLFFPLGILLPLLFRAVNNFPKIIVISFLISLSFECIQLLTILGTFDVDDIVLNVTGAALGFGGYCLVRELMRNGPVHISE